MRGGALDSQDILPYDLGRWADWQTEQSWQTNVHSYLGRSVTIKLDNYTVKPWFSKELIKLIQETNGDYNSFLDYAIRNPIAFGKLGWNHDDIKTIWVALYPFAYSDFIGDIIFDFRTKIPVPVEPYRTLESEKYNNQQYD